MGEFFELLAVLAVMVYGFLLVMGGSPKSANGIYAGIFRWIMGYLKRGLNYCSRILFRWMGRMISWFVRILTRFIRYVILSIARGIRWAGIHIWDIVRTGWTRSWNLYGRARTRWPYATGMLFGGTVFTGIVLGILLIVRR
ncbi:MAG: hypothetical protein Q7S63_01460 [bacterium]|nr:hypothetical protein [bacterium]